MPLRIFSISFLANEIPRYEIKFSLRGFWLDVHRLDTLEESYLPSHPKELLDRGGFTVKLVHLEVQGPSLAPNIHKTQGEILEMSSCCDILKHKMYESEAF